MAVYPALFVHLFARTAHTFACFILLAYSFPPELARGTVEYFCPNLKYPESLCNGLCYKAAIGPMSSQCPTHMSSNCNFSRPGHFFSCVPIIQEKEANFTGNISQQFYEAVWQERMREVQGAIILASMAQVRQGKVR